MFYFSHFKPEGHQNPIMREVEAFRAKNPGGLGHGDFAGEVQNAVENHEGYFKNQPGNVELDKRKTHAISERTVRYYRSKGWIADPFRIKGQGARYHEIHFLQMLTAYKLRLEGKEEAEVRKVATKSLEECLRIFSDNAVNTPRQLSVSADLFQLILVVDGQNQEARRVAKLVSALARRNCSSHIQVSVHDREIDLEEVIGAEEREGVSAEKIDKKMPNPEDGDGTIRNQIQDFRRRHLIAEDAFVQIVTSREHGYNWFADWGATNPRDGVLHLRDYEFQFGVAKEAVTASYALLLAFCGELAGRGISPYGLFHRDGPHGCLFDSCVRKGEIVLKLLAGDICKVCLEKLRPHFTKELLREAMIFQDTIRDRVRVLRQFGADPEVRHQEILRRVYVHARIEANSSGREANLPLPEEGRDLEDWCYDSRVGASLGISRELASLRRLADEDDERVLNESEWNQSRDVILGKLSRLHPNLQLVRIDSISLKPGEIITEGASLWNNSAEPWEFSFDGDLASAGITDAGATYAKIGETESSPRFVKMNTHLRIFNEGGTVQAALRLPDNTVVDYLDGMPLRGCKAFHEKKDD